MLKIIKCKNYAQISDNLHSILDANNTGAKKQIFANPTLFEKSDITTLAEVISNINEKCLENSIFISQIAWEGNSSFIEFQNKLMAIIKPTCDVILLTLSTSKKFDIYIGNT